MGRCSQHEKRNNVTRETESHCLTMHEKRRTILLLKNIYFSNYCEERVDKKLSNIYVQRTIVREIRFDEQEKELCRGTSRG